MTSGGGFDSITLRSGDGRTEAEFVPAANMLCCSLRHDGTELLDRGSGVTAYAHRGKTMGIPLLHPWANRLVGFEYAVAGKRVALPRDEGLIRVDGATGLPIHGVLPGLLRWAVERPQPDSLIATLHWSSRELLACSRSRTNSPSRPASRAEVSSSQRHCGPQASRAFRCHSGTTPT